MHKKLSYSVMALILATAVFPCEAAKLTKAQMEEIYNNGSTTSSTTSTGAKVETRVSTKKILKPNISIRTSSNPATQPKNDGQNVPMQHPNPTVQKKVVVQSKNDPSQNQVKPQVVTKPNPAPVQTKPNVSTTNAQGKVQKPKTLKVSKAKKEKVKTTKAETPVTNSTWKIKTAQKNLRILGLSTEPSTGKITSTTKEALIAFQKKYKLTAKGELNDETYSKLNWEAFAKTGIKNIKGSDVVAKASKYKGVPYVFGGTTPKGFDCSGYVQYVFKELGGKLTRTADTQAEEGIFVNQKQLKPGDLVFFTTYEPGASHVGIYAGNGQFWNASSSRGVVLYNLSDNYWRTRYYGARRVLVNNGELN